MSRTLQDFKNQLSREAHGMTRAEAHAKGVCVACKEPPKLTTDIERREYGISGICPPCFFKICGGGQ